MRALRHLLHALVADTDMFLVYLSNGEELKPASLVLGAPYYVRRCRRCGHITWEGF